MILVAILSAGFAIAFRASLSAATHLFNQAPDVVAVMKSVPSWIRWLLPAVGGLLAGLLGLLVSHWPSGQGVGAVMEAVVLGRVRLSMRNTLLKSVASWCAIVSGGSLGREGPLIQFGGAVGKLVGTKFLLSLENTRLLIAAGTAAGFAAAYNTPFAAVLFVVEIVTGVFVLDAIVPALVATVVATALTRATVGEGPIYGSRSFHLQSPAELLAFMLIGLLAALGAQGFMRLLAFGETCCKNLKLPWRPALGGLAAGLVIAVLPDVAGNGYEPLNNLLDGKIPIALVALLIVGKAVATTASVSSGSPGGVFTPMLLIGGGLGFLCASFLVHVGAIAPSALGGYALIGMAAATAAATHAPLMAAVMVFELSGDYAIVLPLILATAGAALLSRKMSRESIYTAELIKQGIRWNITMEGRHIVE